MVEGSIGSGESCALRLSDPMITPRHARLERVAGLWHLSQEAVASPTLINGRAIELGTRSQLVPGDVVTMGTARLRVGGEPPARRGVDPRNDPALQIWADQLAERGDAYGHRLLEGLPPDLACLGVDVERARQVTPDWLHGALVGIALRSADLRLLYRLCESPAGETIEKIAVPVAARAGEEEERARDVLQVLAATRPPRLHRLDFGWLHQDTELLGAQRDWHSVSRRVPLEGSIHSAVRRAGRPRITILRTAPGWPAVGTRIDLDAIGGPGWGWVAQDPDEPLERTLGAGSSRVHILAPEGGATAVMGASIIINGNPTAHGVLVHGDLVEGPLFAFRFEED